MKFRFLLLLTAATVMCGTAHAGAILELLTTEYSEDPPIVGTVEILTQGKESRIEITSISSNESGGMIYRSSNRELIALDHSTQEYYVFDQKMMDQMAEQVRAALAQTNAALEAMSPEDRALAEQMMQSSADEDELAKVKAKLVATGKSETVAGYGCKYYDVMKAGRKIRDICMTPWKDFAEGQQAAKAMMELADFFEEMREAFAGSGGLNVMDRQQEMFAYMEELDGYPVLSHDFDEDGELASESRLKGARNETLEASMFEPPEGYQRRSLQ